jgi:hypothetical protein
VAFEPSEAGLRIVSVAVANVENPAPGNPACEALKDFIASVHSSGYPRDPFFIASVTILTAKALRCKKSIFGVDTISSWPSLLSRDVHVPIHSERAGKENLSEILELLNSLYSPIQSFTDLSNNGNKTDYIQRAMSLRQDLSGKSVPENEFSIGR